MIDKLRVIGAELGLVKSKVQLENEERLKEKEKADEIFWKEHAKRLSELIPKTSIKKDTNELPKEIDVSLFKNPKIDTPQQQRAREERIRQINRQMIEEKQQEYDVPEDIPYSDQNEKNTSYQSTSNPEGRRQSSYEPRQQQRKPEIRRQSDYIPPSRPRRRTEVINSPFKRTGGDLQRLYSKYYNLFYGK